MPGESQRTPDSDPDPSVYVQAAIDRAARSEREWVEAQLARRDVRFDGIDKATSVLSETVTRTPTEIQKEVAHLKELTNQAIESARALVAYQTECSDKASATQEALFTKQIDALGVLLQKSTDALGVLLQKNTDTLSDRINDIKTRIDRVEAGKLGGTEQRGDSRAAMAFAITVGFFVLAIVGFIITQVATSPTP